MVSEQITRKRVLNDEQKTELLKSVNKREKNCRAGAYFEIPLKPQGAASIYSTTGNEVTKCQNSDLAEKYDIKLLGLFFQVVSGHFIPFGSQIVISLFPASFQLD